MQKKYDLSIIVPIYNTEEESLRRSIESILMQTYKNIEIILVNDGSNSKTVSICDEYCNKDSRIKLINRENSGLSSSRNKGVTTSTSNNIMFVDSDDWLENNACEIVLKYINELNNEYDIIIFNCYAEYKNKTLRNMFYNKKRRLLQEDIEQIKLQNIEKGITNYYPPESNISVAWAKVYNKKFLIDNDLKFNEEIRLLEDTIFNMYSFEKAKNIYILPDYLYHYRKSQDSMYRGFLKDIVTKYEAFFDIAKKYIKLYNKNEKFFDTLNLKIVTSIDIYMTRYFFNKQNKNGFEENKRQLKELLNKEVYQTAFNKVKPQYLSFYQRLILSNAKKERIINLFFLNKIKVFINNHLRIKS